MEDIKNISESVDEIKDIPYGSAFTNTLTIYKVIENHHADSFARGYHRKKSDGYVRGNNACYGIVGYTHLLLRGAMHLIGSYGATIVKMKLLGGLERYVFFDADRDPDIKRALIQTYGKPLSVRDQLYVLTGSHSVADKYAHVYSSNFGGNVAEQIMRETGKIIRGFVCEYGYDDAMVNPLVFSDMITCAVAKNVSRYDSEQDIEKKFVGTLNTEMRDIQNRLVDVVPHLYAVNAKDADGDDNAARVEDKVYAAYTDMWGRHNMLIIDEHNWGNPQDKKLFPDDVKIGDKLSNPSRKGNFTFIMNNQLFSGNVCGRMQNGEGEKATDENGNEVPIFTVRGYEMSDKWYPLTYDVIRWVYQNPNSIGMLVGEGGDEEEDSQANAQEPMPQQNTEPEQGEENNDDWYAGRQALEEAFSPEMSLSDFATANANGGNNIIYVCTHCYNVEGVMQKGFSRAYANANDFRDNGGALTYGDGVYGTPSFMNATTNLSRKTASTSEKPDGHKYGNVILKCVLMGGWKGFLIFDENFAKKVYGDKWQILDQVDVIVKNENANRELKRFITQECAGHELYDPRRAYDGRTNYVIFRMFNNGWNAEQRKADIEKWTAFFRRNNIRGAVYHGQNDKFCCVCYDYSEVIPVALSYDYGAHWTTSGHKWTLSNGKTYSTNGINWDATRERLMAGGDPRSKLGAKYDEVDLSTQRVRFCGGAPVGIVQVAKDGKYNFVTMQDIPGNDGSILYKKYSKIFPIDFDDKASIGALRGTISFVYRGIPFHGNVYNEDANGPTIDIERKSKYPPYKTTDIIEMKYIDWIVDNYKDYINGNYEEDEGEEEYQEVSESMNPQEIKESFFRFLDKMEGY